MTLHMNLDFHPGYQPPKESGDYYCITTESALLQTLPYSAKHGRFNCRDYNEKPVSSMTVRWWAEIPRQLVVPYGLGMPALDPGR